MNSFTAVGGAVLLVLASLCAHSQEASEPAVCSEDIQALVSAALKHSLVEARDLPDLLLIEQHDPVYILNHLWENDCLLDSEVLPDISEGGYVLVTSEELLELAVAAGSDIAYLHSGNARLAQSEASLSLRVRIQQPPGRERRLLCCCGGPIEFALIDGVWRYRRWGPILCS